MIEFIRRIPFLPKTTCRNIEKYLRKKHDWRRLKRSDYVVVSPPKSGRTWLRVLFTRYLQKRHALPSGRLAGKRYKKTGHRDAPNIFFTHEALIYEPLKVLNNKNFYCPKKTLFVSRHPADVTVSFYFHLLHRTNDGTRFIDEARAAKSCDLFTFFMNDSYGIFETISFMNRWADIARYDPNVIIVRYEDMMRNAYREVKRIFDFFGLNVERSEIEEAINYASFENMRKMEDEGAYVSSGSALRSSKGASADARKVRRGKLLGYRDYFNEEQLSEIDAAIARNLDSVFGY